MEQLGQHVAVVDLFDVILIFQQCAQCIAHRPLFELLDIERHQLIDPVERLGNAPRIVKLFKER